MYTTHIHKKKSMVNEITHNRKCCQQKHDTSYGDRQQYKWLPMTYINLSFNIYDVQQISLNNKWCVWKQQIKNVVCRNICSITMTCGKNV
jgi:hypothetical protein